MNFDRLTCPEQPIRARINIVLWKFDSYIRVDHLNIFMNKHCSLRNANLPGLFFVNTRSMVQQIAFKLIIRIDEKKFSVSWATFLVFLIKITYNPKLMLK